MNLRMICLVVCCCLFSLWSNAANINLDLRKRKIEVVDLKDAQVKLIDKSTIDFSGTPEAARSALSIKYKSSDWSGFDRLIVKINPGTDIKSKSLLVTLRDKKKYHRLDPAALLPSTAPVKAGQWTELTYDISGTPRAENREIRIYLNYDKASTGKKLTGTIKILLARKSRKYTSLAFGKPRKRVFPRPYLAARAHIKYALHINWFSDPDYYAERILMLDRSLEKGAEKNDPYAVGGKANFLRTVELMKMSGADGIAMLNIDISRTYLSRTLSGIRYSDAAGLQGVIVPEISIFTRGTGEDYLDKQIKNLGTKAIGADGLLDKLFPAAVKSESTYKFNGKTLISSYNACILPPKFWKEYLAQCRARVGDKILFIVEIRKIFYSAVRRYHANGGLSQDELDEIRAFLNSYLKVCDGILFAGQNHIVEPPKTNRFYYKFYRDLFIPLINSVMNEPQNRGKLLGLGVSKGYLNHIAGDIQSEDGTRNLRSTMEDVLRVNPDYLILVEWNEIKERTSLEPTICDGRSSMRILRYYFNQLKNQPNKPLPGDNPAVPNMILSYRPQVAPGEKLEFELLNVPDTAEPANAVYQVQLNLKNLKGEVVKSLPVRKLDTKSIAETRYSVSADSRLSSEFILLPEVIVTCSGKTQVFKAGFPYLNISPGELRDGKYYKVPLRDLPATDKCMFSAKFKNNAAVISAGIKDRDNIAFVEVLRNRRPVYSAVTDPDYKLTGDQILVKLSWNAWKEAFKDYPSIQIKADGGKIYRAKHSNRGWGRDFSVKLNQPDSVEVKLQKLTHGARRGVYLVIDKSTRELTVSSGKFSRTISIPQLRKNGFYRMLPGNGFNILVEDFRRIADLPPHLNADNCKFTRTIPDVSPRDIMCLRYITKAGRIFRSKPVVFADLSKKMTVSAWNDKAGKPERIEVAAPAVKPIVYDFDPACGAMLKAPGFDSRFYAQLGGSTNYGDPFFNRDNYARNTETLQPQWAKDADGKYMLRFDGKGNNLIIPLYATPAGGFTYELSIKPESIAPQMLLRSYSKTAGAVMVVLDAGKLKVRFVRHDMQMISFTTPNLLETGKWQQLTIAFDMGKFKIRVDNGKIHEFTCVGKPFKMTQMVFGGVGKGIGIKYFKGCLRSLKVYPYSIL